MESQSLYLRWRGTTMHNEAHTYNYEHHNGMSEQYHRCEPLKIEIHLVRISRRWCSSGERLSGIFLIPDASWISSDPVLYCFCH